MSTTAARASGRSAVGIPRSTTDVRRTLARSADPRSASARCQTRRPPERRRCRRSARSVDEPGRLGPRTHRALRGALAPAAPRATVRRARRSRSCRARFNPFEHSRAPRGAPRCPTSTRRVGMLADIREQVSRPVGAGRDGTGRAAADARRIRLSHGRAARAQHVETILQTLQLKRGRPDQPDAAVDPPRGAPSLRNGSVRREAGFARHRRSKRSLRQ